MEAKVILGLLVNQNRDITSKTCEIVKVGDKKESGQNYLVHFHKDDLTILDEI